MSYRKLKKNRFLIPGVILAAGVLTAAILVFVSTQRKPDEMPAYAGTAEDTSGNYIIWHGKKYRYNTHLSNYLLIGIDKRVVQDTSVGQADAGQADLLCLITMDRVKKTVQTLTIPRDTMTQIEIFTPNGESAGKSRDHISLSYAYGDGKYESCRLTEQAVSDLLYGVPIQSSCAISMDGIPKLTEVLGTVTVTVPNNSMEEAYPEFAEGAQVDLTAENTEIFVRYRDTGKSLSALDRMDRQQEYFRAAGAAAKEKAASDSGVAARVYEALEPYMTASMNKGDFVNLAKSAAEGTVLKGWTVPGKGAQGKSFDEYHADDEALQEKIIETFYEEAE